MNEGTPEEVLKKIFRVFDVNGDGSITMKEMTKLIKVSQCQWSASDRLDSLIMNVSGYVRNAEER